MEKKIVVPEGMLQAAHDAHCVRASWTSVFVAGLTKEILTAALRWLSENPIVPTKDQWISLSFDRSVSVVIEWQRRMFLAPEPEVPEELSNLLFDERREQVWADEANHIIRLAYSRGKKSGGR